MTKLLSKSQILSADDLTTLDVLVPEWGGLVRLRVLTGAERDAWEAGTIRQYGTGQRRLELRNLRARLVALCAVDDKGDRLFTDDEVTKLAAKSSAALDRLFEAATKLCGITEDELAEIEEGFTDGPNGASTSG